MVSSFIMAGAAKLGEHIVAALVYVITFVSGPISRGLGLCFWRYLKNLHNHYNHIKTAATGEEPRLMIGENALYYEISVSFPGRDDQSISTHSVKSLFYGSGSRNLFIRGKSGTGKSMLIRYLLLDAIRVKKPIPVLMELYKINEMATSSQISIVDLAYRCMKDFDVALPEGQFPAALREGRFLFLMDGLDDVKGEFIDQTIDTIQAFCSKYPKNDCVITSRTITGTLEQNMETFTVLDMGTLSQEQAVSFARKIWPDNEMSELFCDSLHSALYRKYLPFSKNPLFLSIMFLIFVESGSVPNKLVDFYEQVYQKLYSRRYKAQRFQCRELDERDFKKLLSHFCLHTYLDRKHNFQKTEILRYFDKSIRALEFHQTTAENFLKDSATFHFIINEGNALEFPYTTFQAYFAADYTSQHMSELEQKQLFRRILREYKYREVFDYLKVLSEMNRDLLARLALEDGLRKYWENVHKTTNAELLTLKAFAEGIATNELLLQEPRKSRKPIFFFMGQESTENPQKVYFYNLLTLFREYKRGQYSKDKLSELCKKDDECCKIINRYVRKLVKKKKWADNSPKVQMFSWTEIDHSGSLTNDERMEFYKALIQYRKVPETLYAMTQWLDKLAAKNIDTGSDLKSFLLSL